MTNSGIPAYFIFNVDPIHYILSPSKFLSDAKVLKKIIMISARIISFYCVLDCVRTYTVFLTIIMGSVSNTYSILALLLANFSGLPCRFTVSFCRLSLLVHQMVQEAIEIFGGIALSVIFWALSILIAIIVKKSGDIAPLIFGILLGAAGATLFAVFVCLHVVSSIVKTSNEIVRQCQLKSKLAFVETRNAKFKMAAKAIWYETRAMKPISIHYRPFCNIDITFVMTYVQNVRSRVFDMILIF